MKKNYQSKYFIFLFLVIFLLTGCDNTHQYTISFETNGGSSINDIYAEEGDLFLEPATPTKDGNIFDGWYSDEALSNAYTFDTIPAEDITLYVKWIEIQYTVTFESNGGSVVDSITDKYNANIDTPIEPIKEGYTFIGWYSDESLATPYTFETIPAEDITLYAKWMINQYTITYFDKVDLQIASISLKYLYTATLTNEGRVITWGNNFYGQPEDGTSDNKLTPTELTAQFNLNSGESITSIEAGVYHTVALTSEGRIFTWGLNEFGQLGNGSIDEELIPTEITSKFNLNDGENILSIKAGYYHTLAMTSEGRIFTWGRNNNGQLGFKTSDYKTTPTEITTQFNLNEGENIISIEAGRAHTVALTSEGRIFTWGYNYYGQLGDGTHVVKNTPIEITSQFNLNEGEILISIDAGYSHTEALTSGGRLFTWGYNSYGQLGDGTTLDKLTPIEITSEFNLNLDESIISIEVGLAHTAVITSEGRIFTWGYNSYGQLGDESTDDSFTPIEVTSEFNLNIGESIISIEAGYAHTEALTSEGRLFTWGYDFYGELEDGTTINKIAPSEITQFPKVLVKQSEQNYEYSSIIEELITLVREGYTFDGWYTDEFLTIPFTLESMPAEDITLYAKWVMEE